MPLTKIADGRHREVKRMLVIDLVVRCLFEDIGKIRVFKHKYATWLEQTLDPCHNRMKVRNVTQHVGTQHCIRLSMRRDDLLCEIVIKKATHRLNACVRGDTCNVRRWFDSQMANADLRKMLQQNSVVAANLNHEGIMRW